MEQQLKRFIGSAAGVFLSLASSMVLAATAAPDQLLVTVANSSGDSIYDLNLSPGKGTPPVPAISNLTTLVNSAADAKTHGNFEALVWAPNAACKSLDLIVADSTRGQILRYPGASTLPNCYNPANGTPTLNPVGQVIFKWSKPGSGPAQPNGLSVDANGNLFVISTTGSFESKPSVWVLPFNKTANLYCSNQPAGAFCAPVLIDNRFGGVLTLVLAETAVASTTTPLWKAGDLLVLVGDTFAARLTVYSQSTLYTSTGTLNASHLNLNGPSSVAIPFKQFLQVLAAPFGMDQWPADPAHGIGASLLLTTIDGRILRFDTAKSAFVANFAQALGLGLQKIKVGTYANIPYAFVAQIEARGTGQILAFAAPASSGTNKPFASVTSGVMNPRGLAVTSSGSAPVPQNCTDCTVDPLGPAAVTTYTPPPGVSFPGTVTEQNCIVQADPRVTTTSGWSCNGSALPIGSGTAYCPSFPAAIIPGSVCGHSGPTGAGFAVLEGTATGLDPVANNTFFQTALNIDTVLPGPTNLECTPYVSGARIPLTAWGTRSDLTTIEGTIAEDTLAIPTLGGAPGYLSELTTSCDTSTSGSHGISIFAYGLALSDSSQSYVYELQTQKYQALEEAVTDAAIAATTQARLQTTITTAENYVTAAEGGANVTANIDCALAQIYATDLFLRSHLSDFSSNLVATSPGGGNPDPAGDIDSRLANWYLTLNTEILGNAPPTIPTASGYPLPFPVAASSVPPACFTIGGAVSGLASGGSGPSGLVLLDNGGDNLSIPSGANGVFTFPTALPAGSGYNVTVQSSPAGLNCTVANGSGTVSNANITNVAISCGVGGAQPPSVSNLYYDGPTYQNVHFTESNVDHCTIGDLAYAYANNDSQYDLEPIPPYSTPASVAFYLPLYPATSQPLYGVNTMTLTCYGFDANGTAVPVQAPAFAGPLLIRNPAATQSATPILTIGTFTADPSDNSLSWTTTGATTCSILDEFSSYNRIVTSSSITAPPLLYQPTSASHMIYSNACPVTTIGFPDTVTLSCTDPVNGTAVKTTTVTWNANACLIE
jgi:hypothetical protein